MGDPKLKSSLDLVDECDNFPYFQNDPEGEIKFFKDFYKLVFAKGNHRYGYIPAKVVKNMPWTEDFEVDEASRTVCIDERCDATSAFKKQLDRARELESFDILKGWRNELYPILKFPNKANMERSGSALFGIATLGVHMTAYTRTPEGVKIWVPRRAKTKQTYGGMLDNSVAGGIAAGEKPFESLVREASEEASLPEDFVRRNAQPCGTISYTMIRDERAGGEAGLVQPEVQYVYDLELPKDIIPKPSDNEVEEFYLWNVEEVQKAMARGEFKPNCALCLLDFLVRHGFVTDENEPNYLEIISRLHRRLPFPT